MDAIQTMKKKNQRDEANKLDSLKAYEERQAEIKKLLKKIGVGLERHDKNASIAGGHHWGHVGDLSHIVSVLTEVHARLPKQ